MSTMDSQHIIGLSIILMFCIIHSDGAVKTSFSDKTLTLAIYKTSEVKLSFSPPLISSADITFSYQEDNKNISKSMNHQYILRISKRTVPAGTDSIDVEITGNMVGHVTLGIESTSHQFVTSSVADTFIIITVVHNYPLVILNAIIGWIYFLAWSVSFYPQAVLNWKRKSVIGLNFDFLGYNITGFVCYGFFNVGMYWFPSIMKEYKELHPRGVNPVQLNDVVFTLHAIVITLVTIGQCVIYDRGGQRISRVALGILITIWVFSTIGLIIAGAGGITWLSYLYLFSYIKLFITLIKYIPQALMNYRRQSTEGWSIGNVLLDFTGGSLSMLQMFFIAYNNDDWGSIFGDPTKFGLGLFSMLFDILFIVQHYILYRKTQVPYDDLDMK